MELSAVGQRCVSQREPELGLGQVEGLEAGRITIYFPGPRERRTYARTTSVLKRVVFRVGDTLRLRDGSAWLIEGTREENGLVTYTGAGGRAARETEIADATAVHSPLERLLSGQVEPMSVFALRARTLEWRAQLRGSPLRGYLGGRVELVPHQFYILDQVAARRTPRVLLADEVGLGKTIEAGLIMQRLLAVGQASRLLVLVPESLIHQWFVELLRRFNLWFTILDEARCRAIEESDPGTNPFTTAQLALASVGLLSQVELRRTQVIAAGWDLVVVDEAHHLGWSPEASSPEYALVEALAQQSPGLILLTATPTEAGDAGHFARLRLLDPDRYRDLARFRAEAEAYGSVAETVAKLIDGSPIGPDELEQLEVLFQRTPDRLQESLEAIRRDPKSGRAAMVRTLLDQHGPGRVMFRNTRAVVPGFPPRRFHPVPMELNSTGDGPSEIEDEEDGLPATTSVATETLIARLNRELLAEEQEAASHLRYPLKQDPRIRWLAQQLRENPGRKFLLICRSQRKVAAIAAALQERINAKVALFHEGLPLVQRDRNAAWFAEPDGAQLLLCSEIGSEGRNFQFAHDLVLFDLPLRPGLIEQRIGRLDRIGQTHPVEIHVPYVVGSGLERVAEWYHQGLDAFRRPLGAGDEYEREFRPRLLELLAQTGRSGIDRAAWDGLIADTQRFRVALEDRLRRGRDRLLELHSFSAPAAEALLARIREAETDPALRRNLVDLLDHFGVRMREHELGDLFLDPNHAYVEAFPSIPADGMLATFDRRRAIAREDIAFLSPDHPLVHDVVDLLLNSPAGSAAFGTLPGERPDLLLEALYVLEAVAERRWHVDAFLAPRPLRVVVSARGEVVTAEYDQRSLMFGVTDGDLPRFLEQPGFNAGILRRMAEAAATQAEIEAAKERETAATRAEAEGTAEIQRLQDLRQLNDHIRAGEITAAEERRYETLRAIKEANLKLASVRLILQVPNGPALRSSRAAPTKR